jgi:selenide,water dikinase
MTALRHAGRELILVGGGHAHVQVLERWRRHEIPDVRLTLVADHPNAIYSGMVPGFVAGQYRAADLTIDLPQLSRGAGARFVRATAARIDACARRIELDGAPDVHYDVASIDVGSSVVGLDVPGVREHAIPIRPIQQLVERLGARTAALKRQNHAGPPRLSVVGAGAGGVELAFALRERLRREGEEHARVTLVDGSSRILPGGSDSLARRVLRICRQLGVALRLGSPVTGVDPDSLQLADGSRLPSDIVIWVAGPTGPPLIHDSELATDARGFLRVRSTFQSLDHDDLLCVGDAATLDAFPDTPKAGVYAVRAGPVLLHNLRALLRGRRLRRFRPQRDFLSLLNVCDGRALGAKWGRSFEGAWVYRLKDRIDRRFVDRFRVVESSSAAR